MIGWWRAWRRRRYLESATLDDALFEDVIERNPTLADLDDDERANLRTLVLLFLREKTLLGWSGLDVDDRMRMTVSIFACLLVLELGIDAYAGFRTVLLVPGRFRHREEFVDERGLIVEDDEELAGSAWPEGPVALSWEDVRTGAHPESPGYNVVLHEFAHRLDMQDGVAEGKPTLGPDMDLDAWREAMRAAYDDFCARVDADEDTEIDPYAATNAAEFFAVLTEVFFEVPDLLDEEYPAVYEQMRRFYRQDPLARWRRGRGLG